MEILNYKLGAITGFLFGLVSPFIAALGVISLTMEALSTITIPLLFPLGFISKLLSLEYFGPTVFLNAIFFALLGFLLQKYLRNHNKNEKIVLYIPLILITIFILIIIIDALLGRVGA